MAAKPGKAKPGKTKADKARTPQGRKAVAGAARAAVLRRAGDGSTPNSRQARGAGRREAILAAALDEFSERGFEAARLDDVAKRAGIAKGTIYLYFRDKDTLFQELLRAMLVPIIGGIEAMGQADLPMKQLAERLRDIFIKEIFETKRKDVIRLMIAEGRRFPKLAEIYYREVLSRIFEALGAVLKRAAARGEAPEGLAEFPQLIAAPGLVAIVWTGLFGELAPLDVRKMMQTHIDILFSSRGKS
ncbi:MAG: TetR/AcrR family transcriptional regulator [Pseudolabrys sp.]|jgi:AcrR family transcriptional regulator